MPQEFGKCVSGTTGDIDIVTHPGGSLFKGNDIKRAVQTGQTQIGERLLSAHENENPIFGTDSIPFLATSYEASVKLYRPPAPSSKRSWKGKAWCSLFRALAGAGALFQQGCEYPCRYGGHQGEILQQGHRAHCRAHRHGAHPIEAAEISQALAAGVIKSLITSAVTGQDSKVWEQLTHFYTVEAWLPRNT